MEKVINLLSSGEFYSRFTHLSAWNENADSFALLNERFPAKQKKLLLKRLSREMEKYDLYQNHIFILSSGSTGEPKWIALSKNSLLENAKSVIRHSKIPLRARWGLFLPLHHVGGMGVLARAAVAGGQVFKPENSKWSVSSFCETWNQNSFLWTSLVPTQLVDLLNAHHENPKSFEFLKNLKGIYLGGASIEEEFLCQALENKWPVIPTYGMSECASQIATSRPDDPVRRLILLDIWKLKPIEFLDKQFEIEGPALASYVSGTGRLKGKYPIPDLLETQSINAANESLQIKPLGRIGNEVKINGELVSLTKIEIALAKDLYKNFPNPPRIFMSSEPDERAGNKLVLFVEQDPEDSEKINLFTKTIDFWNKKALPYERIQNIKKLKKFPTSDLGKILKGELTQRAQIL